MGRKENLLTERHPLFIVVNFLDELTILVEKRQLDCLTIGKCIRSRPMQNAMLVSGGDSDTISHIGYDLTWIVMRFPFIFRYGIAVFMDVAFRDNSFVRLFSLTS